MKKLLIILFLLPGLLRTQYIQQHGHLPGIPSAAEVEKKGVDVGGHLAAQGEEMDVLKQEMHALKKIITEGSLK